MQRHTLIYIIYYNTTTIKKHNGYVPNTLTVYHAVSYTNLYHILSYYNYTSHRIIMVMFPRPRNCSEKFKCMVNLKNKNSLKLITITIKTRKNYRTIIYLGENWMRKMTYNIFFREKIMKLFWNEIILS